MKSKIILSVFTTFFVFAFTYCQTKKIAEFATLQKEIPSLIIELRYASNNNFIGKPIEGYGYNKAILTLEAIEALKKVQEELYKQNLSLIVYDTYRPQKAVDHFVKWAKVLDDTIMKQQFYPNVAKKDLFKNGYISSHSRHSSGSTIDLSIYSFKENKVLDMGTPYDFFSKKSGTNHSDLTTIQKENRKLLLNIMSKYGFRNYPKEWWHFTLRQEPYQNVYFNFEVEE